jgi:hypothetical protein
MPRITKLLAIAAALIATLMPAIAHATVYNYGCRTTDERGNTQLYIAKLDTGKRTITWRGKVFKNLKQLDGCKAEFEATASNGNIVNLCTATQGVADLNVSSGPSGDEDIEHNVECNVVRE